MGCWCFPTTAMFEMCRTQVALIWTHHLHLSQRGWVVNFCVSHLWKVQDPRGPAPNSLTTFSLFSLWPPLPLSRDSHFLASKLFTLCDLHFCAADYLRLPNFLCWRFCWHYPNEIFNLLLYCKYMDKDMVYVNSGIHHRFMCFFSDNERRRQRWKPLRDICFVGTGKYQQVSFLSAL